MTHQFISTTSLCILCCLVLTIATGSLAAQQQPNTLSPEEIAEGWILLFDGETLFGWEAASDVDWKVSSGTILATEGEMGLLYTQSQFADYELKVDFRAEADTNSGVFLRTAAECSDPAPGGDCLELNIAPPPHDFPTGSLVSRKKSDSVTPGEEWHQFSIRLERTEVEVRFDGREILEYEDPSMPLRGYVGLQFNQGAIEFRNVKIRPIGMQPLFSGENLDGWTVYPGQPSVFSVTDEGYLQVINGRGQLESEERFGDFVLQLDVKVNGQELNSGIFFRCIPGEFWQGYESQIQNGYEDGDRTKPADFGTGGIYRRQKARRVIPDDFEWFKKTIIATGAHFAVWVDGYQVSSWTDTREPDSNPREGLRTEPGTIAIQGHDPTTDLLFRNIEIAELAE